MQEQVIIMNDPKTYLIISRGEKTTDEEYDKLLDGILKDLPIFYCFPC